MATTLIREATAADVLRLAELRFEFRAPLGQNKETRNEFIHRCTGWMARTLASGAWHCWVMLVDETIVGQVWVHLIEKIPNPVVEAERHAYITNLYVQENHRGGLGNDLMDAVVAWCQTQEIDAILLWPTERSRTLYQRKGFRVSSDVMVLNNSNRATHEG